MKYLEAAHVVIGSGAGGSTVFHHLASQGKEVLLIEEGPAVSADEFGSMGEAEVLKELYRYGGAQPVFGPSSFSFGEGRLLGGTTELNGGLFWRIPHHTFEAWEKAGHFAGFSQRDIDAIFTSFETMLSVAEVPNRSGFDLASELLEFGAQQTGKASVPVPRAGGHLCKRSNRCALGCPVGAKQSMARTLIPQGQLLGGQILVGHRAVRFETSSRTVRSLLATDLKTGEDITIMGGHFFVAGGAIQSPVLLSKPLRRHKFPISFHLNAKVIAQFRQDIHAENATIFTRQVQTHLDDGIVYMASAFNPTFLALEMAGFEPKEAGDLWRARHQLGIYTAQIAAQKTGYLWTRSGRELITFPLGKSDSARVAAAVGALISDLFSAGAKKVWLPLKGRPNAESDAVALEHLANARYSDWILSSVHAMATLGLSTMESAPFAMNAMSRKYENLWSVDASALPSAVGESPQGTIMAFTKANLIRSFGPA